MSITYYELQVSANYEFTLEQAGPSVHGFSNFDFQTKKDDLRRLQYLSPSRMPSFNYQKDNRSHNSRNTSNVECHIIHPSGILDNSCNKQAYHEYMWEF